MVCHGLHLNYPRLLDKHILVGCHKYVCQDTYGPLTQSYYIQQFIFVCVNKRLCSAVCRLVCWSVIHSFDDLHDANDGLNIFCFTNILAISWSPEFHIWISKMVYRYVDWLHRIFLQTRHRHLLRTRGRGRRQRRRRTLIPHPPLPPPIHLYYKRNSTWWGHRWKREKWN